MVRMLNITDANSATKLLPHLASFVAVLEAGSYSAAARQLGIDKTLLSRRVRTLEDGLGVRLLQRTTRRLAPTDAGRVLFEQAMPALNESVAALSRAADPTRIEGTVRVAGFSQLTKELWAPIIRKLRVEHPGLRLDMRAEERFIDLIDAGVDFALRAGNMPDSSYMARRVGTWEYVLCASPQWVEEHGDSIKSPLDLREHWLLYRGVPRAAHWEFERDGRTLELEAEAAATADSGEVILPLMLQGIGVAPLPTYMAQAYLRSGELVHLLPSWRLTHEHALWIVTPAREHVPTRVTVVMEEVRARIESLVPQWHAVYDGTAQR